MKKQGGSQANSTGKSLEKFIRDKLEEKGYIFVPREKFRVACFNEQPIYTKQFPIAKGIYGTQIYCDFLIYHPEKHPNCLVIESKWQQTSGSVDEKFPYCVANIQETYPHETIILIDGNGYKKQAKEWLCKQIGKKLKAVLTMMDFQKWANDDNL
ncbi:MAG: hypothetical protein Q7R96_02155 [Nanoarchaeota archaeon]|nr:hypothetical protein [Nanoarchaeota archaeon]